MIVIQSVLKIFGLRKYLKRWNVFFARTMSEDQNRKHT